MMPFAIVVMVTLFATDLADQAINDSDEALSLLQLQSARIAVSTTEVDEVDHANSGATHTVGQVGQANCSCTSMGQATPRNGYICSDSKLNSFCAQDERCVNKGSWVMNKETHGHWHSQICKMDTVTEKLFESFRICHQCQNFKRLGEPHDGGYLTCMDGHQDIVGVLSVGVEQHDQWSDDVAKLFNVSVGQFDCTVAEGANCGGRCTFHKQCLGSVDPKKWSSLRPMITLEQSMKEMGWEKAKDRTLLLKMDIEGGEWPIYEVEPLQTLRKFKQIIMEFHGLDRRDQHEKMYTALHRLHEAGFHPVHLHGNNYAGVYSGGDGAKVPDVLEVTFMHGVPARPTCTSWEHLALDHRNNDKAPEITGVHLPNITAQM